MKLKTFGKTLLATGIAVGLGLSQTAMANPTATDELEVQVELVAGLSLSCGTLNFGKVNVELGNRNGVYEVTVDPTNASTDPAQMSNTTGNASLGGDSARGVCQISGYTSALDITLSATANESGSIELTPATDSGIAEGDALSGLNVALSLADHQQSSVAAPWNGSSANVFTGDSTGEGDTIDFFIGGTLEIPNNIVDVNLGVYDGTFTIEVTEVDNTNS